MSTYKNFAVVGAGNIGKFIVDELLKLKASGAISSVIVISRSDASTPEWISKGAKFAIVDYDSPPTFASAFSDVDVVISTVGRDGVPKQIGLAVAAKSANVKLFIPSDFDTPLSKTEPGTPAYDKLQAHNKLKELDLPFVSFRTGLFTDAIFVPFLGFDLENGKFDIGGEGNSPLSFTTRPDIARYLAYVLTTLPPSKLEWRTFAIEGERLTFNEVISRYQAKTGKKLEVTYTSREVLQERLSKNPADFLSFLKLVFDKGEGISGTELDNGEWPEWKPKKVLDVIA